MTKTILATWGLCLVFAVGVDVAIAAGGQQPASPRVEALHLTDCSLPCWIGIIPGKTTLGEARKQIAKTFAQAGDYSATYLDNEPDFVVAYMLKDKQYGFQFPVAVISTDSLGDQSVVSEVKFQFDKASLAGAAYVPTLGEIQSLIGQPERVIVVPNYLGEALQYGSADVGIWLYGNPASLLNPSDEIFIYHSQGYGNTPDRGEPYPWAGFSPSSRRYPNECNSSPANATICNP